MLRAGYTFLDTKDKSPDTEKDELQYRPKNKLTLEGKYTFLFGLSAYMNIMYVADQVYYSRTTPLEKRNLDNYALVNLKFDQTFFNGLMDVYLGQTIFLTRITRKVTDFPWPAARYMVVWNFIFKKRVLPQPICFEDLRQNGILQETVNL